MVVIYTKPLRHTRTSINNAKVRLGNWDVIAKCSANVIFKGPRMKAVFLDVFIRHYMHILHIHVDKSTVDLLLD